jgi:isoleucyl-tRNA synthetase
MDILFQYICHWLAPVLSFTAEEAWGMYNKEERIHERLFPKVEEKWSRSELDGKWKRIREIRHVIASAIEQERLAKTIASGLQANVVLFVDKETSKLLNGVDMAELAIISQFNMAVAIPKSGAVILDEVPGVGAIVTEAEGEKCQRCWKILKEVKPPSLCKRCTEFMKTFSGEK